MKDIITERLILTEITKHDADLYFRMMNSPKFIEFIADRGIKTHQDAEKYIENRVLRHYTEHGYGPFKMSLKADGTDIGTCGLFKRPNLDHPDIGYAILPEAEGHGFTIEAARAVLKYAFKDLEMTKILGITAQNHTRSQSLLLKLGMKIIGKTILPDDTEELLLFQLTNPT